MEAKIRKIQELKKEKNAVIMAHYYVPDEVQDIADYVGDSYYLSEMATKVDAEIIVLCGVSFMGESAKILNTEKKVLRLQMRTARWRIWPIQSELQKYGRNMKMSPLSATSTLLRN